MEEPTEAKTDVRTRQVSWGGLTFFWMRLKKLSPLISFHSVPHTEEPISLTQCDWVGRGARPWLTKWISQQQTQEASKEGRWPGRFVWAGHSVIIMHSCLGHKMTLPVGPLSSRKLLWGKASSVKEKFETPSYSHPLSCIIPSGPLL